VSAVVAMVSWRVGSVARVRCFVLDDLPPILDASDRDGFGLSISSAGTVMTREGAAFANELAVAARRYAAECTRMVSAGPGGAATPPGSGATLLAIPDEALTMAGMAFWDELDRATARTPTGDPRHAYPDEVVEAAVAGAAPVIVACELRRLVTEVAGDAGRYGWVWALTARADELDPGGAGSRP
jgi:hypothetical protein